MGPKGINPRVLEQLNQYFNEAISDKDLVEVITNKSGIVMQKMTPSEFGDYLIKDMELWKKVVSKKVSQEKPDAIICNSRRSPEPFI